MCQGSVHAVVPCAMCKQDETSDSVRPALDIFNELSEVGRLAAKRFERSIMLISVAVPLRLVRRPPCSLLRSYANAASRSKRTAKALPLRSRGSIPNTTHAERGRPPTAKGSAPPAFTSTSIQQYRAKQLYDAGIRQVYEARGSSRVIFAYAVGACFVGYAINLWALRHWDRDTLTGMGSYQKTFVAGSNRVAMFACSVVGGLIVLRYSGLIRSIRLVDTGHGNIKLDIHMRRRVPWSNTRYTVEPGGVVMPRKWQQSVIPDAETKSGRNLVTLLGRPYAWLKSWILMDGIVAPVRLSSEAAGMLDTSGNFSISLNEFSAITSQSDR